jgi:site-specific DNA-methyltransferase (adenine-specific)
MNELTNTTEPQIAYSECCTLPFVSLYNEDCIETMKRIPDGSIDLMLTDPPYNTTQSSFEYDIDLKTLWAEYERILKPNGLILMFADEPFTSKVILSKIEWFKIRITWDKVTKRGFLNAKKMMLKQTEDIVLFSKCANGQYTYNPILYKKEKENIRIRKQYTATGQTCYGKTNGGDKQTDDTMGYPSNLITFNADGKECNNGELGKRFHVNQKPVDLMRYLILTYSNKGETVYDGYSGSGATAEACIIEGRKFIGSELNKEYFDKSVLRLKNVPQSLF